MIDWVVSVEEEAFVVPRGTRVGGVDFWCALIFMKKLSRLRCFGRSDELSVVLRCLELPC